MKWQVMVSTSSLNIRTGPSTSYRSVGYINEGKLGVVVDSKTVGGATWYKWEDGTWSCGTSSTGEKYINFVYNLESENNEPGGDVEQPSNNTNNTKPYITPDNLYSFYESDYGKNTNNISFGDSDDWYIESNINLKDKVEVTDEQIRDEISRIKYNMDISYATKDDVYEVGKGSIGYLTDLQKKMHHSFNRNKIAYPDRELTKTFAYVFFTRPDLNILTYGSDRASEFSLNRSVVGVDPKYSYIFHNNENTLRSLVTNGNPYHKFLILLSNEAKSFEVADTVIKTTEDGETFNGNKIIYGRTDHESNSAGEFNIRYVDSLNLDVFKLHLIWVDYINKVSRGIFEPKEEYMKRKILDYACSCYYFLCGPDGSTILYWQKLTGVFPVNTGENTFSWDSGTLLSKPEINIRYMYSMRSVMDIAHLSEFNALTKINGDVVDNTNLSKPSTKFKSAYSPKHIQTGSTLTHSPYIWQTTDVAGNMIFRLMWCGNK
jgi:hypothetical protein